ncbi:hypothetical protein CB0940_00133 [Cercospora beticola]|uniref:Uncharacterized protein n=1 Tax=Cercospora beticola TaxID=122368 RepID=A0A2G5ICA7_CERBT|nr:hypothetical protein CB0940_00133 [Cercospora beticola]PIB02380.1 hypothetical protein CB0940_00133 [Cercospora beticola]
MTTTVVLPIHQGVRNGLALAGRVPLTNAASKLKHNDVVRETCETDREAVGGAVRIEAGGSVMHVAVAFPNAQRLVRVRAGQDVVKNGPAARHHDGRDVFVLGTTPSVTGVCGDVRLLVQMEPDLFLVPHLCTCISALVFNQSTAYPNTKRLGTTPFFRWKTGRTAANTCCNHLQHPNCNNPPTTLLYLPKQTEKRKPTSEH